ncbi:MAG: adenylyltransferase/cytidyltransferase family protein [Patescibacteria group bacterium]|nr:adenylyltransferase/cytidyltransferase family protein [Patescibacteria group bacterium]
MKKRIGLVVARMQPLHPGHIVLMETAFRENDKIVICIGSAQKADPLHIGERRKRIVERLNSLGYDVGLYKIFELDDIESDKEWPLYLKNGCEIAGGTENTFYTSDNLPKDYLKAMRDLGFRIRIIERGSFDYEASNGTVHTVSSATEIREICERFGLEV